MHLGEGRIDAVAEKHPPPKGISRFLMEELSAETLIYDVERHRAHALNPLAAFLFRAIDGRRQVGELSRMTEDEFGNPIPEEVITLGLDRLKRARLVDWEGTLAPPEGMTRRQAIRRMAAVSLVLPTVLTITTPLPTQAATAIQGKACNLATLGQCCTNGKTCIQRKNGKFGCQGPPC